MQFLVIFLFWSMPQKPLSFDYQSSTPCSPEVVAAMEPYWNAYWGNASSRQNSSGIYAAAAVSFARDKIAECLQLHPENLVFTSGATEANNLALLGSARARAKELGRPGHLITMSTEHHAVLDPLRQLRKEGFQLTEISPLPSGLISLDTFEKNFRDDTFLVSIMLANNEIGVVQPLGEIAEICKSRNVIFHSDFVQAIGYLTLDIENLGVDLFSLSAHKIYGPKGIGALAIKRKVPIDPIQWGGGQEEGLRPGTLPVPLIIGFSKAIEIAFKDITFMKKKYQSLRNELLVGLKESIDGIKINGSLDHRLPNNLNITIPDVLGSQLHQQLRPLISCSSGSACSKGSPSHVLKALGRSQKEAESSLRLSIGRDTSFDDIQVAVKEITRVVSNLRE